MAEVPEAADAGVECGGCDVSTFEQRFPVGSAFLHCGHYCIVMRYVDASEAYHTGRELGMHYEYVDANQVIRSGSIAPREYCVIEAQNR